MSHPADLNPVEYEWRLVGPEALIHLFRRERGLYGLTVPPMAISMCSKALNPKEDLGLPEGSDRCGFCVRISRELGDSGGLTKAKERYETARAAYEAVLAEVRGLTARLSSARKELDRATVALNQEQTNAEGKQGKV